MPPSTDSTDFEFHEHCDTILSGLNRLREHGFLFDVTINVGPTTFKAHRVVLASCSEYFRAIFTDEMLEKELPEITLNGVTPVGFQNLLNYAYTSKLTLAINTVEDILSSAEYLQMLTVVDACIDFLLSHLDVHNCLGILNIAKLFSLGNLTKKVYMFIGENIKTLAMMSEFQENATFDLLSDLLNGVYPINDAEVNVLEFLFRWLQCDTLQRESEVTRLLEMINFDCIFNEDLCDKMRESVIFDDIQSRCPGVIAQIHKLCENKPCVWINTTEQIGLENLRGFEQTILNVGGFQQQEISNDVSYLHPVTQKWHVLTKVPHLKQAGFGVVVVKNELYVIGGSFYDKDATEVVHNFCFKYNPSSDKWTQIASMKYERCLFTLVAEGDKLYAIGGEGHSNDQLNAGQGDLEELPEGHVEFYDTSTNAWSEVESCPLHTTQHCGASVGVSIYVCGGSDTISDQVSSALFKYNTQSDTPGAWTQGTDMLNPRAGHCIVAKEEKLYVAGGWQTDANNPRNMNNTVDVYHTAIGQWETLTQIPNPRIHCSMTIIGQNLFLIGGRQNIHRFRCKPSSRVNVYNLNDDNWTSVDDYPAHIQEHQSCVMFVKTCIEPQLVTCSNDKLY